jgi:hypothetical protein
MPKCIVPGHILWKKSINTEICVHVLPPPPPTLPCSFFPVFFFFVLMKQLFLDFLVTREISV